MIRLLASPRCARHCKRTGLSPSLGAFKFIFMLQKLRAKPDHVKKSLSLFLTIVIFSVILFVWLSSWDARSREDESRAKAVSPLSGFGTMFEGFTAGLRESISDAPWGGKNASSSPQASDEQVPLSVATSSPSFDISGVIVIDGSVGTTTVATSSVSVKK